MEANKFWDKVDKGEVGSDCWLWLGATWGNNHYGAVRYDGRMQSAHRVSWQLWRGIIPNGKLILHKCDVSTCVNPNHLYIGDYSDNMRDMNMRGRTNHEPKNVGERNGQAKLTGTQVDMIVASNLTYQEIAYAYGISTSQVGRIKNGQLWKQKIGEKP